MTRRITLLAGPCAGLLVGLVMHRYQWSSEASWTAGIASWTAIWWILEPIAMPATSLIPIAFLPLVGVLESKEVAAAYGHKLILLLLGGCMLSAAMERSGAHRRIALIMVALMGGSSKRRLVLGFMVTSAFLSMWISNTATTLMLLPIALAVLERAEDKQLDVALLLGIAYAASIGGTATPVGTPPNLLFMSNYEEVTKSAVSFLQWMQWTLPIVVVMVPVAGFWLTRQLSQGQPIELPEVGNWRAEEIRTLVVFAATALLWVTREEPYGGWSNWAGLPEASDASVALVAVLVLFVIPNGRGNTLLDWQSAVRIPWGVLILFSSGLVLAKGFEKSGLSEAIGSVLAAWGTLPAIMLISIICLTITFLTEVTSNTATASLILPILGAAAIAIQVDPKLLMIPATISASFAFMLPVATAPNAVVFGSEKISVRTMAREGVLLNLLGAAAVTVFCYAMFG